MPRLPVPVTAACLLAAAPGATSLAAQDYRMAQLIVQQRVVVKMQRAQPRPLRWSEKKGPKCLPLGGFAGALIAEPDAVDLVTDTGRYRARLDDDCPSLDFYAGFYFKPTRDGQVCAKRDALRSRSGRMCGIERFQRLVAKR